MAYSENYTQLEAFKPTNGNGFQPPSPERGPSQAMGVLSQIKAGQEDKSQTEDNMRAFPHFCFTSRNIIHPNSRFAMHWQDLSILFVSYCAVWVPYEFCFDPPLPLWFRIAEVVVDVFFLVDIWVRFNTGFFDSLAANPEDRNVLVQDRTRIARRYLSGPFWVDGPASVPLALLSFLVEGMHQITFLRLLRMLRLIKLFQISSVAQMISFMEIYMGIPAAVIRLFCTILIIIYSAHLVGCFWYYVWVMEEAEDNWISSYDDSYVRGELTKAYWYSLYWSFTTLTTVGYGDICPITESERLFTMCIFLAGVCGFGYLTGNISTLVTELTRASNQYREKIDVVQDYMRYRQFSKELQSEILHYFEIYWIRTPLYDEDDILARMTPDLKVKVCEHLASHVLMDNRMFCRHGPEFLMSVINILKPITRKPGSTITKSGSQATEMFFLTKGVVKVMSEENEDHCLYTLKEPSSFGEGGLFGGLRRTTTVAEDLCDLFSLSGDEVKKVLAEFPAIGTIVYEEIKMERQKKNQRRRQMRINKASGEEKALLRIQHQMVQWYEGRKRRKMAVLEEENIGKAQAALGLDAQGLRSVGKNAQACTEQMEQMAESITMLNMQLETITEKQTSDTERLELQLSQCMKAIQALPLQVATLIGKNDSKGPNTSPSTPRGGKLLSPRGSRK